MVAPESEKSPLENAAWEGHGIWLRGRQHRWSADRLTKRADRLWWVTALATAATASGVVAAIADSPGFAWLAAVFAAATATTGDYTRRKRPDETARIHARAADQWEALYVSYKSFWRDTGPQMTEQQAALTFSQLEGRRAALIEGSPAVEPAAERAIEAEDVARGQT